ICLISLLAPLPLANVPAAAITVLIALAYLEHDGLLLILTQILGLAILSLISVLALFGANHI
ncbi:MAG TPA: exopolysaccharide biosynthesis protein, partial [Alphaproteobacteria bacterium]|nr:exopolysaccharide biosynthesis protein [Alphaproteobacteria bacterium]